MLGGTSGLLARAPTAGLAPAGAGASWRQCRGTVAQWAPPTWARRLGRRHGGSLPFSPASPPSPPSGRPTTPPRPCDGAVSRPALTRRSRPTTPARRRRAAQKARVRPAGGQTHSQTCAGQASRPQRRASAEQDTPPARQARHQTTRRSTDRRTDTAAAPQDIWRVPISALSRRRSRRRSRVAGRRDSLAAGD
jgi:hypothetical protein